MAIIPNLTIQQGFELAVQHHQAGRLAQAEILYRQILAVEPRHADALHLLGVSAHQLGKHDAAVDLIRKAIALAPDNAACHSNLSEVLRVLGRCEDAADAASRAILLQPDYAEAHNNLGNALYLLHRCDEADTAFRRALELRPNFPEAHNNLGNVLRDTGRLDEAIGSYRQAMAVEPEHPANHSNLIYTLHFHPGHDAPVILDEERQWNRHFAEPLRKFHRPHANNRDPGRKLRLGYVSADLCDHVVGRNVLPIVERHEREQFEVFCYSGSARRDALSQRFQQAATGWRDIAAASDENIAQIIREDHI